MKRALLFNWFDLPAGSEAAFDSWHNREHVTERLSVPGFVQGRRFVSIDRPEIGRASCRDRVCYAV